MFVRILYVECRVFPSVPVTGPVLRVSPWSGVGTCSTNVVTVTGEWVVDDSRSRHTFKGCVGSRVGLSTGHGPDTPSRGA